MINWVVYKQFPGIRGELQGGIWEFFSMCFFSDIFPSISRSNCPSKIAKHPNFSYAQNLILVNLILVNFFSFLVIARNHSDIYGRNLVEIDPTSLPQLSIQLRDQKNSKKTEKTEIQNFENIHKFNKY